MPRISKQARIARTELALRKLNAGQDPRPVSRGRSGAWIPGAELPPLRDFIGTQPTEEVLGMRLITECRLRYGLHPELRALFHVPNGGKRGKFEAARLKQQGVRPGVLDYMLPRSRGGYHGLAIELKRHDGGLEAEQRQEIIELTAAGYLAVACWGDEAAMATLLWYLAGCVGRPPWEAA